MLKRILKGREVQKFCGGAGGHMEMILGCSCFPFVMYLSMIEETQ